MVICGPADDPAIGGAPATGGGDGFPPESPSDTTKHYSYLKSIAQY